jgi:hypothetical protein
MTTPMTISELWAVLKPLKDTAHGPDGISHIYLKKIWDIIGPLILNWHCNTEKYRMPVELSLVRGSTLLSSSLA